MTIAMDHQAGDTTPQYFIEYAGKIDVGKEKKKANTAAKKKWSAANRGAARFG